MSDGRQRTLELTIRLNADGFEVDVYEPGERRD